MFLPNIMHAGGRIKTYTYTNSVEAVLASLAAGERHIELDCVLLKDGFGFAHDETEAHLYNLDRSFLSISLDEFRCLRVYSKFTPLTFDTLYDIMRACDNLIIVIDFKGTVSQFGDLVSFARARFSSCFSRLCFQVYDDSWTSVLLSQNVSFALPALWRYFDADPYSPAALDFVQRSVENISSVFGVSVRWVNPTTGLLNAASPSLAVLREITPFIFFHGQDNYLRFSEQVRLANRFGFFTSLTLKQLPLDFDAARYLSLHHDLASFDELMAKCHYVEFGQNEGRRYR